MFRTITLCSVLFALLLIVVGTVGRIFEADLACPDWPACYGQLFIADSHQFETAANALYPDKPVDIAKVWLALAERYTLVLFLSTLVLMLLSVFRQRQERLIAWLSWFCLTLFAGVMTYASARAVESASMPIVSGAQSLASFLSFWLAAWLYLRLKPELSKLARSNGPIKLGYFALTVLVIQTGLGIWVAVNHAGSACVGFPQCNGQWWPEADYRGALEGLQGPLAHDAQVAIHWLHQLFALPVFLILALLAVWAGFADCTKSVKRAALMLGVMLIAQVAWLLVYATFGLSSGTIVAHDLLAALTMLPVIAIVVYSRYGVIGEVAERVAAETVVEGVPVELGALPVEPAPEPLYLRLKSQLQKTRSGLGSILSALPVGQKSIDEDLLEDIEARLLMADLGMDVTTTIIKHLTDGLERHQLNDGEALQQALKQELLAILKPCSHPLRIPKQDKPFVILVVGVNGAGKTTTIGKMAKRFQAQGHSVMLAAGDTFRAAAVEQLQTWGERNQIHVVAQHTGADSASVIYDGVQSAQAKGIDVLIADTAGRLHTKSNLMDELKKVRRIIGKLDETAPHEVLLVLDAGTGQNALSQAKQFNEAVALTGIALTKLDGTAKGGVIFALAKQFGVPIRFIGIGEGIDDLQDFDAEQFVDALFAKDQ
ncbi:MAG: hypothetical protein Kow0065_02700 [Methylomicrobium sp.]